MAHGPTRKLQKEHRGIDIPSFPDGRVNEGCPCGVHFNGIFASQPAQHIKEMNRLITILPARHFDVCNRRWLGVASRDVHHFEFAELALMKGFPDANVVWVKSATEAHQNG